MRDMYNNTELVYVINETVTSGGGAVNVSDIDCRGFDEIMIEVSVGANGGDTLNGTNYFTVDVEHGDDGTTYADVDETDILGATPASSVILTIDAAAEDEAVYRFGYIGNKRYLDITVTPNGTLTNGNPFTVTLIKGRPHNAPV